MQNFNALYVKEKMNKTFKIGEEYEVLDVKESMSWSNTLKCVSRSGDMIEFEEIDGNDNMCGCYILCIKKKFVGVSNYVEYCEVAIDCIVQAD